MTRDEPLSLVSLSQKRQVEMMAYAEKYTFIRYWALLVMHTHPLAQIRYRLDP